MQCRPALRRSARPEGAAAVNNHKFGDKSDFLRLVLLRKLALRKLRLGFIAMLTEPLACAPDAQWEQTHSYLRDGRFRPFGEDVHDYLRTTVLEAGGGDVRNLAAARIGNSQLLPRAKFFLDELRLGSRQRESYFARLCANRALLRQPVLYFAPTAGVQAAGRPGNPQPDYLAPAELRAVAAAAPRASLLIAQPFRAPPLSDAGVPTRAYGRHRTIANLLRPLADASDSLMLLHSGCDAHYALLRASSPLRSLLPQLCPSIGFACRAA